MHIPKTAEDSNYFASTVAPTIAATGERLLLRASDDRLSAVAAIVAATDRCDSPSRLVYIRPISNPLSYVLCIHIRHVFCYFIRIGHKYDNFTVGLTNISPRVSTPTLNNYTLCGQYPGAVPHGTTVSLYCKDCLPPFRYVIVQIPALNVRFIACEIEVLVIGGTRMSNINIGLHCILIFHSSRQLYNVDVISPTCRSRRTPSNNCIAWFAWLLS